jgi:hypothetical protein
MSEAQNTDTDTNSAASVAAVMPCVGGLIFWVAQNSIEAHAGIERQHESEILRKGNATGAARECIE